MLPCGHSLCEECIQAYYPRSSGVYTYSVGICDFCGIDAQSLLSTLPVTVEPNLAAIDGGGVRGVVALVLLQRLQAALDTEQQVRDYFDYFIGTSAGKSDNVKTSTHLSRLISSGGLIVLDHVICRTSLTSSLERFGALSSRIFPRKSYGFMSVFERLVDWLIWWCSDNKYDSGTLEDVVQEVFGVRQRLFEFSAQPELGSKVAITATTVSTSQLRLFTNYNGVARSKQGKGMCTIQCLLH